MVIAWQKILPVLVSIGIIILVAILREYSTKLAAVLATMPINIPLALWLVYSGNSNPSGLADFTGMLFVNIFPTLLFLLVAYLLARAGWGLVPILALSYTSWALSLGALLLLRQLLGV